MYSNSKKYSWNAWLYFHKELNDYFKPKPARCMNNFGPNYEGGWFVISFQFIYSSGEAENLRTLYQLSSIGVVTSCWGTVSQVLLVIAQSGVMKRTTRVAIIWLKFKAICVSHKDIDPKHTLKNNFQLLERLRPSALLKLHGLCFYTGSVSENQSV